MPPAAEQVAAGQAHTLFLVNPASLDLDKLDSWECETAVEEAAAPSADAAKGGTRLHPAEAGSFGLLRWLIVVRAELTVTPSPPNPLCKLNIGCCHLSAGSKRKGAAAGGGAKKGRKK